ncbi:AbfB domain-containing protein [Plantactinospora alkalitolerans]|uniref:AbfB domain-containing protein n=1 Tax=Plantactinospora alkalitolerans TaxID=2789879 RepID=UPI002B214B35|nr:AbfB domain-containing protein [Plantactinospora alkalitolerans]
MVVTRRALLKAAAASGGLSAVSVVGLPGTAWAANTGATTDGGLVSRWGTPSWVRLKFSNLPDYFVRHYAYALRLDPDDGSSTYRADATFYPTAGLADPAWTSFRSFNFPDRHLRHANYLLRIDPLNASSSEADRQDATFRITS